MELRFVTLVVLIALAISPAALAWGNGRSTYGDATFADDAYEWQSSNMYGTHDYIAEKALDFLPSGEKSWIIRRIFLYGTELPDSRGYDESMNDRNAQYVYFDNRGSVTSDSLAQRAMKKYDLVISSLKGGVNGTASKYAGAIVSYVSDAALFTRVIEGSENGAKYEGYMLTLTDTQNRSTAGFEEVYGGYIKYDGSLEMISPYDAVMRIAKAAYEGKKDGSCSANWMESNYDTSNPNFVACTGRNLNNAINAMADVLHTLYQAGVNGESYELYSQDWKIPSEPQETPEAPANEKPAEGAPEEPAPDLETLPSDKPAQSEPKPYEPTYVPAPVPQPKRASEGGAWLYVVAIIAIAVFALVAFRELGRKKRKIPEKKSKEPEKISKKK